MVDPQDRLLSWLLCEFDFFGPSRSWGRRLRLPATGKKSKFSITNLRYALILYTLHTLFLLLLDRYRIFTLNWITRFARHSLIWICRFLRKICEMTCNSWEKERERNMTSEIHQIRSWHDYFVVFCRFLQVVKWLATIKRKRKLYVEKIKLKIWLLKFANYTLITIRVLLLNF